MKVCTIIQKEYRQIVKKKSFWISTFLTPLIMAGIMIVPLLLTKVGREEKTIEVIDFSGIIADQFIDRSRQNKEVQHTLKLKFIKPETKHEEQAALFNDYEKRPAQKREVDFPLLPDQKQKIVARQIDGIVFVPAGVERSRRVYFCAANVSDFGTNEYIASTVQKILSEKILTEKNIEIDIVAEAIRDIHLDTYKVKKEGAKRSSSGTEYAMAIFMLAILFTVLMAYGQLIMRGVIEEKNNRIVEVLISSTNAQHLFYGKIVGIGLAGLTQVALWTLLAALFFGASSFGVGQDIAGFLTPELGLYFLLFFIIGYFMYAILFSIVGAAVNSDEEAQQFAAPITFFLFIPFVIGIAVTQDPNTPLVTAASLFPLFTPTLMFLRINVAVPPLFQIVLSIFLSSLFTLFLAWLGARIFRIGILMYGKKPSLKEIMRWLTYK